MAKQSNNGHNGDGDSRYSMPDEFITSKGATIRFIGLNPARMDKLQNAGTMPPKPFRLIENDLGDPQREELSENDLQNDQERAEWADYKAKVAAVEQKRNENVMKYVFNEGFAVDDSEIDAWKQEEEEEYGVELPTSRLQLRVDFINAKVIGNTDDLANIMAGVLERTGVPPEMLEEVRDSFRNTVRQGTTPEVTSKQGTER